MEAGTIYKYYNMGFFVMSFFFIKMVDGWVYSGTWTPLHADVFSSYSWSANVCGKKLWYFSPPSQTHLLFDRYQYMATLPT